MLWFLSLVLDYWPILAGVGLVGTIACLFLVPSIAEKLTIPIVFLVMVLLAYISGKRNEKNQTGERTRIQNEKRKQAYKEIDNRGTTHDDLVERLRNNGF